MNKICPDPHFPIRQRGREEREISLRDQDEEEETL